MKTQLQKAMLSKKVITLLILILSFSGFAQISSTTTGGDWGETTTWVGGNIPQASDNVIIAASATVNLNVAGACNNLTVNGSLLLNTASRSLIVTGTTTINNNGVVNFTTTTTTANLRSFNDIVVNAGGSWNSQSLTTITGSVANNGTFTTGTASTLTFSGENKTFTGADISLNQTTTSITGSYTNNSDNLTINGVLSGGGSFTNGINRTLRLMGNANAITSFDASASPNTVIYGRAGVQQVLQGSYHILLIEGNNTKTMRGPVTVSNNVNIISAATLFDNGHALNGDIGSTLNIDGELQLGAATATALPTTFSTLNINTGSTIHYSSTNAAGQEVDHLPDYHHLKVSGNSIKSITGNITLPGDLTIVSGTLDVQEFNIIVNGNGLNTGLQTGTGKVILSGGTSEHSIRGSYTNLELNDNQGASLANNLIILGTLEMTLGELSLLTRSVTIEGNVISSGQGTFYITPANNGDIIISGDQGGSAGTIYMASEPNNSIRRFTMDRTGENASVTFSNTVRIRDQFNVVNGNIVHNGNLTLGVTTSTLITKIVNGTLASPPVFNTFTGLYRVQYGDGAILNTNLVTGAQGEIPANNAVDRLILNNNTQNTISLSENITVTGALTLTTGFLLLGENNLYASYTGTGATGTVNSYIVTNGSGQLFRNIPLASTGNFNFPIGTETSFSLVNINFIDNSNMQAGIIGARVIGSTPPIGDTENYLNKYWVFTDEREGQSYTYRPTFTFNNQEIHGIGPELIVGRFDGTDWDIFPPAAVTATTLTMQGSINQPLDGEGVLFTGLSEPSGSFNPPTVWDIIINSADHNTLESAIQLAGLEEVLQGEGPFTVFAPTDAAFELLPPGVFDALTADPEGALADVLRYHVVGGAAYMSNTLTDGQTITTLNGQSVVVNISGMNILINNSLVTTPDLIANNGVVHVINAVLIPEDETSVNNLFSNKINIYPNPAKESFFIDCIECVNTSYELMTIDGKVVRSGRLINEREQVMKGDLSAGIYLVKIFNNMGFTSKKVIFE